MIAGLEEAARRAEQVEQREQARRKGGGSTLNAALHTDDTGRRWAMQVRLGIAGAVALIVAASWFMIWSANHETKDPRKLKAQTQAMITRLITTSSRLPGFSGDVTPATVQEALVKLIDSDLAEVNAAIASDKEHRKNGGQFRPRDKTLSEDADALNEMRQMRDAWGRPLVFSIDGDKLKIASTTNPGGGVAALEPVIVPLKKAGSTDAPPPAEPAQK